MGLPLHLRAWLTAAGLAADPFGFSGGLGPIPLDQRPDGGAGWMSAEDCGDCHTAELRQWTDSRHHRAFTNDLFQAGLIAEPQAFCVHCHAPTAPQVAEVLPNLPAYAALSPRSAPGPGLAFAPEPRAAEGVGCAACHLRDGAVLSAGPDAPAAPHPIRVEPRFGTAAACRGCHQFLAPDGPSTPRWWMQSTWAEWQISEPDGDPDCLDCHMKGGDHAMTGAHDADRLRGALEVRPAPGGLRLTARGVGHRLPTGDLFRAITVEIARGEAVPAASAQAEGWEELWRAGRRFSAVEGADGAIHKQPVEDSRLWPDQPVLVPLPDTPGLRWRVRYHFGAPHDLVRGLAPLEAWVLTLADGPAASPPP